MKKLRTNFIGINCYYKNPVMNAKQLAAEKAVEFVKDGMTVGLGTGSTAFYAIKKLGELVAEGLKIKAVASSLASAEIAKQEGILLAGMMEISQIDVTIDGADEVDEHFNLVKGGGGALTREKILAFNSRKFIVIVDQSKLCKKLGNFPVAVEVIPFGWNLTCSQLEALGCTATVRKSEEQFYKTDNGNWILDCRFDEISNPAELNTAIQSIPGVIENGIFPSSVVDMVIAGFENGEVKVFKNSRT